jgi:hypothetical protein
MSPEGFDVVVFPVTVFGLPQLETPPWTPPEVAALQLTSKNKANAGKTAARTPCFMSLLRALIGASIRLIGEPHE